ncbi:tetratricopeptide repeat protein 39B-like [Sorex araneus]|uniref:tetratricopeptide repeat protein 39B-like n=1 Tax=Sorex araneus TaxID=42254 RepID=UPI000649FB75|nr:tetratricopeptide repeat protein 39B-like [Sorex araneus]
MALTVRKRDSKSQDFSLRLSKRENEKEERFEDAFEVIPAASTMSLRSSLEECTTGLYLFLNNRFSEALNLISPWSKSSLYHAIMYGILMVVKSALTLDPQDIEAGSTAAKDALRTCYSFRRKSWVSLYRLVRRQGSQAVPEEELHADVCYAESLILKAAVTFIQDDSVLGYLRSGLAISSSYQIYKDCQQTLTRTPSGQSKTYKHLVGGIKFGVGVFNLLMSHVPPKQLKLLNVVGYSGNREVGLALLCESATESHINSVLSALMLLFYHGYVHVSFGMGKVSSPAAERLLLLHSQRFPNCVILKFFHARFCMLAGEFAEAQLKLHECVFVQSEWKHARHLCYWELMWCDIFLQNWKQAFQYARLLFQQSRWSKAIYSYSKAAILALLPSDFARLVSEDASSLFLKVESLRIKVLGTSVPVEKFIAVKGQRYGSTTGWYPAQPMLEFLYAWSGFRVMSKKLDLISSWLMIIDKGEVLLRERAHTEYWADDITLLYLLKGLCLKHLGKYLMAEHYFNSVLQREKLLKYDHYLVPYTYYELGILYYLKGDSASAAKSLDNVKNYRDYSMESRLQFRVHIAFEQIFKEL